VVEKKEIDEEHATRMERIMKEHQDSTEALKDEHKEEITKRM
jgi:hypothetical protein